MEFEEPSGVSGNVAVKQHVGERYEAQSEHMGSASHHWQGKNGIIRRQ